MCLKQTHNYVRCGHPETHGLVYLNRCPASHNNDSVKEKHGDFLDHFGFKSESCTRIDIDDTSLTGFCPSCCLRSSERVSKNKRDYRDEVNYTTPEMHAELLAGRARRMQWLTRAMMMGRRRRRAERGGIDLAPVEQLKRRGVVEVEQRDGPSSPLKAARASGAAESSTTVHSGDVRGDDCAATSAGKGPKAVEESTLAERLRLVNQSIWGGRSGVMDGAGKFCG